MGFGAFLIKLHPVLAEQVVEVAAPGCEEPLVKHSGDPDSRSVLETEPRERYGVAVGVGFVLPRRINRVVCEYSKIPLGQGLLHHSKGKRRYQHLHYEVMKTKSWIEAMCIHTVVSLVDEGSRASPPEEDVVRRNVPQSRLRGDGEEASSVESRQRVSDETRLDGERLVGPGHVGNGSLEVPAEHLPDLVEGLRAA